MVNEFSYRFIRHHLQSKTDGEIADMLEIPESEVHAIIEQITSNAAGIMSKSQRLLLALPEMEHPEIKTEAKKRRKAESLEAKEKKMQAAKIARTNKQLAKEQMKVSRNLINHKPRRQTLPLFKTCDQDLSKKISVRIDAKTTVFVNPGTDIEKIKALYTKK